MAATLAVTLAGCDLLLGLNQYENVTCAFSFECPEAGPDGPSADAADSGLDGASNEGGDAPSDAVAPPEGGYPAPAATQVWVHWLMPNPDAASAPGFPDAGALPNPMTYDAGADGGAPTVYDAVTGLTWWRASLPATSLEDADSGAWEQCQGLGPGWRLPTRIELVSLVDFTQPSPSPTIDPVAFPSTPTEVFWTSSPVPAETGPVGLWTVSFATGLASYYSGATQVRCVQQGATQ